MVLTSTLCVALISIVICIYILCGEFLLKDVNRSAKSEELELDIGDNTNSALILSIENIIDRLRKPGKRVFGPVRWSNLSSDIVREWENEYEGCDNGSRIILHDEHLFRDDRAPHVANIPVGLRDYVTINTKPSEWDVKGIIKWTEHASARAEFVGPEVYPHSARQHYQLLAKYHHLVSGKNVLVAGSVSPWLESILLSFGAKVTTVDYNPPKITNNKLLNETVNLNILTMDELKRSQHRFDAVFSFSSIEHDGLGRYGDPINPKGDIAAMFEFYSFLKYDAQAFLFLGIPTTDSDHLIYNHHRLYGPCRFKRLVWDLGLFEVIDVFGSNDDEANITKEEALDDKYVFNGDEQAWAHQPIFALKKKIVDDSHVKHINDLIG
eukprot:CAMPEP_0202689558 /NCGR_PEP_ID=MMETSP1385-20130828/4776_1 /ASSEMBLY_ACC=CAM_ASM_000861 /TAXON_ID=933848 /ORGANISM="Elphidium margaritaceum" /LENGTH=380 /DNA_ID=CAMNT_0049344699 /DNA_START=19 /DNA_END=1161 /DNA_ORIENTATION=-